MLDEAVMSRNAGLTVVEITQSKSHYAV